MFNDVPLISNFKSSMKFAKKSFIFSIFLGVIISASYIYNTTPYYTITDSLAISKAKFKLSGWSMPSKIIPYFVHKYVKNDPNAQLITDYEKRNITQVYRRYDGFKYDAYSIDILNNQNINNNREYLIYNTSDGLKYGLYSIPAIFTLILVLAIIIKIIQSKTPKEKYIKGAKLSTVRKFNRRLKIRFKASHLKLANLHMVKGYENKHILFGGTTGAGKSNALMQLLKQIRKFSIYWLFGFIPFITRIKGQRAIVIDTGEGTLIKKFYDPKRGDKILNIGDRRTEPWTPIGEIKEEPDFEEVAAAFIKRPEGISTIWSDAARLIVAELLRIMYRDGNYSNKKLYQHIFYDEIPDLEKLMKTSGASRLIKEQNMKTTLSVLMQCLEPLKALKYFPDGDTPFSIHEWVANEKDDSWLFLSCNSNHLNLMKSLLTFWVTSSTNALMRAGQNKKRRLWFIVDELFNLDRIQDLPRMLRELRKYGACIVVCFQSFTELVAVYNANIARSLLNNINTKVLFINSDDDTAEQISKLLGKADIKKLKTSYNITEDGKKTTSYNFEDDEKTIVSADDIKALEPGQAYIKFTGKHPVVKVQYKDKDLPTIAKDFDPVDNLNIEFNADLEMQKKYKNKYVKPVISSYMFHEHIFVIMLSNNEKLEVDINHFSALHAADQKELVKINLSEDKQTVIWPTLGVMLNLNNIEEYIDSLKNDILIEEFYFNAGVLVAELNNGETHIVSIDKLQCNAINKGADESLMNGSHIKDQIKLSKDRKYFTWDGVDYKLDIKEIENISNSNRSISLEEKNQKEAI